MPLTNEAKNTMLAELVGKTSPANTITDLSIHTADPGTTGANEVSSGSYARVGVTEADFDAPSAGSVELNNDKNFVAANNEDATYFGVWDGSTFLGGGSLSGDQSFNAEGEYILNSGTSIDIA